MLPRPCRIPDMHYLLPPVLAETPGHSSIPPAAVPELSGGAATVAYSDTELIAWGRDVGHGLLMVGVLLTILLVKMMITPPKAPPNRAGERADGGVAGAGPVRAYASHGAARNRSTMESRGGRR